MSRTLRLVLVLLSLILAVLAVAYRYYTVDPSIEAAAASLSEAGGGRAIDLYREALARDDASPYRWADLAEALTTAGRIPEARACFSRALDLAPAVPQIWVRQANFCFTQGDHQGAIRAASRVFAAVPDYDSILFHYFDQMETSPSAVLSAIGENPRAIRSWLRHAIETDRTTDAKIAWKHVCANGTVENSLAFQYVAYLIRVKAWHEATFAWSGWLGARAGDYPAHNLVYNSSFREAPTGGLLDWTLAEDSEAFQITREKDGARVHFAGKSNPDLNGLWQTVVLPVAGRYRLTARIKGSGLTTNEGPRFAVPELNLESEPLLGSQNWTIVELDFAVAQPRTVRVAMVRHPSQKFDNRIQGDVWITDVTLKPSS